MEEDNYLDVKDIEHRRCREFLKDKNCEFCEKIFDDLVNKKGVYEKIEFPPQLEESDRKEFVRKAKGFARTHALCNKHFRIFRNENKKLNENGEDITESLELKKIRKSDL